MADGWYAPIPSSPPSSASPPSVSEWPMAFSPVISCPVLFFLHASLSSPHQLISPSPLHLHSEVGEPALCASTASPAAPLSSLFFFGAASTPRTPRTPYYSIPPPQGDASYATLTLGKAVAARGGAENKLLLPWMFWCVRSSARGRNGGVRDRVGPGVIIPSVLPRCAYCGVWVYTRSEWRRGVVHA